MRLCRLLASAVLVPLPAAANGKPPLRAGAAFLTARA